MIFKKMKKRNLILFVSLVLVIGLAAGGTLAYLTAKSDSVVNTFTPAKSSTYIDEGKFDGSVKHYAKVTNTSEDNVTVYIRAQVIVTWKKGNDVLGETPVAGTDYDITYPSNSGWFKVGDYYYYKDKVAKDDSTNNLLTDGKAYKDKGDYQLSIEILAQSIQADPASAVEEAWPAVKVDSNGKLIKK